MQLQLEVEVKWLLDACRHHDSGTEQQETATTIGTRQFFRAGEKKDERTEKGRGSNRTCIRTPIHRVTAQKDARMHPLQQQHNS